MVGLLGQRFKAGAQRFRGLLGGMTPPNSAGGLLSAEEAAAAQQQARMTLASSLLQASGPSPVPIGFGQALGMGLERSQAAQAGAIDSSLSRRLLEAQIGNLQQGGQERSDPNVIRALVMAGIDPKSPEGQDIVVKSLTGGNDQLEAIQTQLAIDARRDQIARDRAADEKTAAESERERTTLGNTIRRSIVQTGDIAALTEKLEGSFLSAGMPASSWRRTGASLLAGAGAALGMNVESLERDLGNFDKLKKGMSDQLNNLVSSGSLGQVTNDKLQSFRDALANTETSPPAIMSIQAGIAEALLEEADNRGVEVGDREKIEANIRRWRAYETEPDSGAPGAAPDFSKMTDEQLRRFIDGK